MKFNIIYNNYITDYEKALSKLKEALIFHKLEFKTFNLEDMDFYGDFTFVIGGDGTLLRAAKFYSKTHTPVFGINIGRLGYLSQINIDEISDIIKKIINKEFFTEERLMLTASDYIALNDLVIKGCNPSRTSKFYLEINDKTVCDYIADGLIISTPTGTTAYALSAGGPILHPAIEALTIVPICPHTLNVRPLVIPISENLAIKTVDKMLSVYIDGYNMIECTNKVEIKLAKAKAKLAFLNDKNFYSVIRDKLNWGICPKNN